MTRGFWDNLPQPFFVLAPMANVTDTVFRQIIRKYSRPDVMYTEFVSCDGLCSAGRERLLRDLQFVPAERPLVAQVFGATPEHFYETAKLVVSLGFDGIDINMGCPDRAVVRQGAGAALIRTPLLAQAIVRATRDGVRDAGSAIPVSVKTRLGFQADEAERWLPHLLELDLPALTVHARTKKELSEVPAHWDRLSAVVALAAGTSTHIIGNGDVTSIEDARAKSAASGVDGVMLGRAIFGNPWLFRDNTERPPVPEVLRVVVEHTELYETTWGAAKPFDLMKKHYKAYVTGFPGAHELRIELMACRDAESVRRTVESFLADTHR
ncbi:MAG: tRNA dihydrouridine synthase [Patescibacteria group bacterium]|jgi:nifR3 family TIM-barrel protein